jgi:hypothetical protein
MIDHSDKHDSLYSVPGDYVTPSRTSGLTLHSHKELRQLVSEIRAALLTIRIHRAL